MCTICVTRILVVLRATHVAPSINLTAIPLLKDITLNKNWLKRFFVYSCSGRQSLLALLARETVSTTLHAVRLSQQWNWLTYYIAVCVVRRCKLMSDEGGVGRFGSIQSVNMRKTDVKWWGRKTKFSHKVSVNDSSRSTCVTCQVWWDWLNNIWQTDNNDSSTAIPPNYLDLL